VFAHPVKWVICKVVVNFLVVLVAISVIERLGHPYMPSGVSVSSATVKI
jgi:hypothetical protein